MIRNTNEFVSLVTKYSASLKPFALSFTKDADDAQDLIQETVLRSLSSQGSYAEGTNVKAWMYTIMKNIFINSYRRNKKRNAVLDSLGNSQNSGISSVAFNDGESDIEMAEIKCEIDKLNSDYSVPFMMHFKGFKYNEIAEHLDMPVGTVKSRIHFARQVLKGALSGLNLCQSAT